MDTKQRKYCDLIERVKASYPERNPSNNGNEPRLYWCDDCKEINLWTYWQGSGNLDAKIMLVGQDWGCPWDDSSQPTMEQVRKANEGRAYDYLHNNPSPTDANLTQLFNELGYDITKPCSDLFFTNFVLGYRNKGTSGGYKKDWAENDKGYFKELTDIIQPRVILCLAPYFAPESSIINISSSRDRMSQPQSESYTAAKGGISALTHALAVSFSGKVRVNSISPGWIDTAYTVYEGPDAIQQPAGRVGNPLDIANMVLFLASDKAGFITGENICIDGGQTRLMIYHGDNGWTLNL